MNRFQVRVQITRKNFDKTKSAKYKAELSFVSNQYGVIYDWKIKFKELHIDIFTTPSWFKDNEHVNLSRRKELFKLLNLEVLKRPNPSTRKIVKLSDEHIEIANNFFNNRDLYDSTIKNIVGILKGNNPGGEAKKPSSAELIIDSDESVRNFVILFDDLVMKNKVPYDIAIIAAKDIEFNEFCKLNTTIESAFNFMQQSKTWDTFSMYLKNIKEFYKKYNSDDDMAHRIANLARSRFGKNVDKNIKALPFGFSSKEEFQKCHIYEFHDLREKILEAIRNGKETKKYEEMISDHENFIPLPEEVHRKFDRYAFTYKTNGDIWPIHQEGQEYVENRMVDRFKKIPKEFLTPKRRKYIEYRNSQISYLD